MDSPSRGQNEGDCDGANWSWEYLVQLGIEVSSWANVCHLNGYSFSWRLNFVFKDFVPHDQSNAIYEYCRNPQAISLSPKPWICRFLR